MKVNSLNIFDAEAIQRAIEKQEYKNPILFP